MNVIVNYQSVSFAKDLLTELLNSSDLSEDVESVREDLEQLCEEFQSIVDTPRFVDDE